MEEEDIISPELRAELGINESAGPLVLDGKRKKKKKTSKTKDASSKFKTEGHVAVERPHNSVPSKKRSQRGAAEFLEEQKITKRKKKALEKIAEEKSRKERRKQLFSSLAENQLSAQELELLKSSAAIGRKETQKDVLKDELLRERAGLLKTQQETIEFQTQLINQSKQSKRKRKRSANLISDQKNQNRVFVPDQSSDDGSDDNSDDGIEFDKTAQDNGEENHEPMEVCDAQEKSTERMDVEPESTTEKVPPTSKVIELMKNMQDIDDSKSKFVVRVRRSPDAQKSRGELPVCMMEQEIMDTIEHNYVTVLCGETGSGKTTQVPQFLFEAGYGFQDMPDASKRGMIGVTQPRRVATVSMARRVAHELGCNQADVDYKGTVGYQIRHDSHTVNEKTRIKFMTDGVLLREARDDLLLRKYSVIILDEAHERNLNTDVLLGILSRVVPLREQIFKEKSMPDVYPLRVIIMSATLRVDDFAKNPRLFTEYRPPVVNVQSRQYPVTTHFSRKTELRNYLEATFSKVCAIHKRLPAGGILVFLTGQREIEWLVNTLRNKFKGNNVEKAAKPSRHQNVVKQQAASADDNKDNVGEELDSETDYSDIESDQEDEDKEQDAENKEQDAENMEDEGDEIDGLEQTDKKKSKKKEKTPPKTLPVSAASRIKEASGKVNAAHDDSVGPVVVLPLYSRLPTKQQLEVFKEVPAGHRLIVVATNVAETSVTIPGMRYVVDCGREKRKVHDQVRGTSKFEVGWISQASANQRMGRAGRTGPGHCYRLYSSAVFNDHFEQFGQPEISKLPIEDVVLYMKTMGIENVESFPFPSPPNTDAVKAAESRLVQLGALKMKQLGGSTQSVITPLGRRVTHFPVRARFGKMLAIASCDTAQDVKRLAYVVAVTAALSLQEPFLHMPVIEEGRASNAVKSKTDDDEEQGKDQKEEVGKEKEDNRDKLAKEREVEKKAKLREHALKVQEMWRDTSSDSLSLLIAAGAYAHILATKSQRQADVFCQNHFLHSKTMKEQAQLRQQLARIAAGMNVRAMESDQTYDPDSDSESEELENQGEDDFDDESTSQASLILHQESQMKTKISTLAQRLGGVLVPMKDADRVYLRQVLTSGFLDQVARKMTKEEARAVSTDFDFKLSKRWPYVPCNPSMGDVLFIHPHSNLFKKNSAELPEFVVYGHVTVVERRGSSKYQKKKHGEKEKKLLDKETSLSNNNRDDYEDSDESDESEEEQEEEEDKEYVHYMNQVTAVHSSWLFELSKGTDQCNLSTVLEQPPPTYDAVQDELLACVYPMFGPKRWKLASQWVPFPADSEELLRERARWFGRSLLEGKVLPALQKVKDWLAIPPAYMVRKMHDPRVEALVRALMRGRKTKSSKWKPVYSRALLYDTWDRDPTFLYKELRDWIQKDHRPDFKAQWSDIIKS